ncbi:MAG: hypothetical protein ACFWTJ_02520 [Lachnoclostridium sp.]|jgi:hypothetical protein
MENKLKKYRANVFYVGDNEILGNTIPDISYEDLQPYLDKDTFSLRYEKTLVENSCSVAIRPKSVLKQNNPENRHLY